MSEATIKFLRTIFGEQFPGKLSIWTKQDRKTRFFGGDELTECAKYCMDRSQDSDVYFGACLLRANIPPGRRGTADDVVAMPGLWLDIDVGSEGHTGKNYPPDVQTAWKLVRKFPLEPSIAVRTGHGLHTYWCFEDLQMLEDPLTREKAKKLSRDFQAVMAKNFRDFGFDLDNVGDLARVLRVPGTRNFKTKDVKDVKIIHVKGKKDAVIQYHSIDDLQQAIADELGQTANTESMPAMGGESAMGNAAILFHPRLGCPFMRHCIASAATLTEPEWFAALTIIAVSDHPHEAAHELSRDYPRYSFKMTETKMNRIITGDAGPHTCETIRSGCGAACCEGCFHSFKSPATLVSQGRFQKALKADELLQEVLKKTEGGDKSAHLEPGSINAFADIKKVSIALFNEYREIIKTSKAPLADFDKAVNDLCKVVATVEMNPPSAPIYQPVVAALAGSKYVLNEDGQLFSVNSDGDAILVADFIIVPTAEVLLDDGAKVDRQFEVYGIAKGGVPLSSEIITDQELDRIRSVVKKWGLRARIHVGFNNENYVRDAVYDQAKGLPEHRVFTHTGWRQVDRRWVFVHAGGSVGDESIRVQLDEGLENYVLPEPKEDFAEAVRFSLNLRKIAPYTVTVPILAATYLSILCEALRRARLEPKFALWAHGKTGVRKTSLALVMMHHFGKFLSAPSSFKDTANAVGRKLFLAKDVPLLIDDYHPSGSLKEKQELQRVATNSFRLIGDRDGKARVTPRIKLVGSQPPRGIAIMTGEDLPPGGESDMARTFTVKIGPKDIDLAALKMAQDNQDQLAEAMTAYIAWLAPQMDEMPKRLRKRFLELRTFYTKDGCQGRAPEAAAWLQIGWETFLRFACESQAITEKLQTILAKKGQAAIGKLAQVQGQLVRGQQPVEIFLAALKELLETRKVSFHPINLTPSSIGSDYNSLGYKDRTFYYLHADSVYNVVEKYLRERRESLGVSPRTLWENLADLNHIEFEVENRGASTERKMFRKKKQVDASESRPRLLWLKRSSVDEAKSPDDE